MPKGIAKYILLFAGLVLFLVAYFVVYTNYTDKTDALNAEMKTLSDRLAVLEGYRDRLPEYREGIKEDREKIGGVLSRYYSAEWPEDFILFANAMEDGVGTDITALSFTEPGFIFQIAGVKESGDEEKDEKDTLPLEPLTLTACGISSAITGTMTYEQMKKALDFIYAQKDVTTLESLNVTFDSSTGLLLGDFIVNKYFITGRDIPVHQPVIQYDSLGNNALMGG